MISVSTLRRLYELKKYDDFIKTINEHFEGPEKNDYGNAVKLTNLVTFLNVFSLLLLQKSKPLVLKINYN